MSQEKSYYTSREAAEYLGLALKTVRLYVSRRTLTPSHRIGSAWLLPRAELDRYRSERRPCGHHGHRQRAGTSCSDA